jgi:AraC-like DNA-binding protein
MDKVGTNVLHEQISFPENESIVVRYEDKPKFTYPWHFHSEFELVYVIRSFGTRYVADHVSSFADGDLVLLGSNLPHFWRNDEDYYEDDSINRVSVMIVQFQKSFMALKESLFTEFSSIQRLLANARRGIHFYGSDTEEVGKMVRRLTGKKGVERLLYFIQILDHLAHSSEYKLLASESFSNDLMMHKSVRIEKVMNYLAANFTRSIKLTTIASISGLSETAFCRYFKEKTGKSLTVYLNELRVGHACKLLIEERLSITAICYESGFNNQSNFNKAFKKITGKTPSAYQSEFKVNNEKMIHTYSTRL